MASEVLYNGIELSAVWPPADLDPYSREPIRIPYLERPPHPIRIGLGRQLFVDDFLIEKTNLTRTYDRPQLHPAAPVLVPETPIELDDGKSPMAAPFNDGICYDPIDRKFKLWYMPGWSYNTTAMAVSEDGIKWKRPDLDVEPGTNLVWKQREGVYRDGCAVWLDHETEDEASRFKMFQYYRHLTDSGITVECGLHTSADGVHWSAPVFTPRVGDNTTFFYNPYRRKWCKSIRRSTEDVTRLRYYHESDDFLGGARWDPSVDEVFWQRTDRLDLPDPERPDHKVVVYDLNATPYESLMLGLFAIFRGPENDIAFREGVPKTHDLEMGYSRDGFFFDRPDRRPFLASSRRDGEWNRGYLHAAAGLCTIVGDELFFYFGAFSGLSPKLGPGEEAKPGHCRQRMYAGGSTGLAILRRDGFASLDAASNAGYVTTRPVVFKGDRLFVNVANPGGLLRAEVQELDGAPVEGLGLESCRPVAADDTRVQVSWSGRDLSAVEGRAVRLHLQLQNGRLFSFWVTDDPGGASYGYLAAGGPGLMRGRDMPEGQ